MTDKVEAIHLKEEGNTAFKEKRYLDALVLYSDAIKVDRNNASLWGNRAATYYNLNLFDKAIEDSAYAIELSPQTAKYYWRKGMAHLQLGQLYAAKLAFQNGLKQEPFNENLRAALAERKAGEPAYSGKNANLSWEQKREKALEFKGEGNKLFGQKKYQPAVEKYGIAIEYDPTDPVFYTNRAACYTELKKYDEAISDCKMAVALGKSNGVNNLGQTQTLENRLFAKTYMRLAIAYERKNEFKLGYDAAKEGLKYETSPALTELCNKLEGKAK